MRSFSLSDQMYGIRILTIIIHIKNWFRITPPNSVIRLAIQFWQEGERVARVCRCKMIFRRCRFLKCHSAWLRSWEWWKDNKKLPFVYVYTCTYTDYLRAKEFAARFFLLYEKFEWENGIIPPAQCPYATFVMKWPLAFQRDIAIYRTYTKVPYLWTRKSRYKIAELILYPSCRWRHFEWVKRFSTVYLVSVLPPPWLKWITNVSLK